MFATPSTPTTQVQFDFTRQRRTSLHPEMRGTSYEHPSPPSAQTPATFKLSRPQPTSEKRPKLSLQTSSLPITFGKSSTALAITASALPVVSPTILNTFNNAYDIPHRFSPVTTSPTGNRSARTTCRLISPFALNKDDRPYQVPHGLKSILRNSPVPSGLRRSSLCLSSESPRTGRRVFFPAAKKVTFRVVLEEEIQTTIYITKHSDLSSDEEGSGSDEHSDVSLSSSDESELDATLIEDNDPQIYCQRRKRKTRSDRQVQAVAIRDWIGHPTRIHKRLKATPNTRRKRRRRQWEWTLEPPKEIISSSPTYRRKASADQPLGHVPVADGPTFVSHAIVRGHANGVKVMVTHTEDITIIRDSAITGTKTPTAKGIEKES